MKNFLIYALIGLGVITYNVSTQADREGAGEGAIVSEGNVDAFTIQLGDCFDNTGSLVNEETGEVSDLPGVPCSQPHDNEVFAIFDLDQPTFPGSEAISEMSFDACLDRFESFVGLDYETSSLDIAALYPTKESWSQQGDREVVCAVYDVNLGKLTGSTRNSGIWIIAALRDGEIEVALVLTEGAVLDILKGSDNRLVSIYVESPLVWGIHVAADGPVTAVAAGQHVAISRFGSGSHLIAFTGRHSSVDHYRRGLDQRLTVVLVAYPGAVSLLCGIAENHGYQIF